MIDLEPGLVFGGRYQVIKPIGAGGMGAVYLARDSRHQDFCVALKVLYPGVIKTREARERFRNEIVASYKVNHPNIVRAYEYFDEEDFQAYAMEYVDGGDLFTRIKLGPLPPSEVLSILKQAASGLAAVHEQGIVHRDLKPENLLLSSSGLVKITDFGVARLKGTNTITQAGAMVGTPKYLAPEYVELGECDHRGDIYALGVIGYEMISGGSPFKSDSKVSLMVERLRLSVEPLARSARHCPPALARVIERAMAVTLSKRYQNVQEMLHDLDLVEQGKDPLFAEDQPVKGKLQGIISDLFRPEPTIFGLPGARSNTPASGIRRMLSSKIGPLLALLSVLFASLCAVVLWDLGSGSAIRDLNELPKGIYRGWISGAMADSIEYPFKAWRTDAGVFIQMGKPYCAISKLSDDGVFSCGDLKFKLRAETLEGRAAVGTVTELGWGNKGTWNLVESGAGEIL